jgi:hypothetical protein
LSTIKRIKEQNKTMKEISKSIDYLGRVSSEAKLPPVGSR